MSLLTIDQFLTTKLFIVAPQPWLQWLLFGVASVFVYLLPVVLIYLFWRYPRARLPAIQIVLIAVIAWQVLSQLIGHYLYTHYGFRERPFADLGITELLFEQPQKAFPSDHSAVLMVASLGFFHYNFRKLGWFFLVGGAFSSFCRVVLGFHWVGDIIGGWLFALVAYYIWRFIEKPVSKLINRLLRSLHLLNDLE